MIASFVTVVEMLMKAYTPPLYEALGVFIPLIVVNTALFWGVPGFRLEEYAAGFGALGVRDRFGLYAFLTAVGAVRREYWAAARSSASASGTTVTCR